jgi:hypothetical protein
MRLSRRGFLQAVGVTVAASQLGALAPLAALAEHPLMGRVLEPVTLGGATLWPDAVVRILDADETRYRLPQGWVAASAVQPLFLDAPTTPMQSVPAYVEVHAPAAPVYQNAAVGAALLAHIGHGGVLGVRDALHNEAGAVEWVAVRLAQTTGWVQAARVRAAEPEPRAQLAQPPAGAAATVDRLVVDRTRQTLTARSDAQILLTTRISTSAANALRAEETSLYSAAPTQALPDSTSHVQSWWLRARNGFELSGVYWHNGFGTPQPGPDIQLPVAVARWLYGVVQPRTMLVVV